ncbi:alpha/beta hydrolase [Sphingobacterium sp. SRCM116780]|uniref:alpha/beta hydrolase n=1 Tax=Sphingobacterium sp. SRCM116780 TaxID=2907623 RepID=UPI001F45F626|nr:alpha/beta hydrolase [Sphingobacterium sp. SRCM116780]UIR55601.1 alpha/beta hydrolase [Sphingobacterium sp. SRCM116780]
MKVYFWIILFHIFCSTSTAQALIKMDTSFTVQGAFIKESKKRPYITVAERIDSTVLTLHQIPYKKTEDRILSLDAYVPRDFDSKYPCIVLIHGGNWQSGNKEMMATMARSLAHQFVVLSVEYRLALEAKFPAAYVDLTDAILWAKSQKQLPIDTKRIAVIGTDAGGQLASLLGTNAYQNKESIVQSVINIDGVLAFHHSESQEEEAAAFWLGGTYDQNPIQWKNASPLYQVNSSTAPMLFLNSSIPHFHTGRADMMKKMNDFGIHSEFFVFDDTPHTFWLFNPWFDPMMDKIKDFLDRTL